MHSCALSSERDVSICYCHCIYDEFWEEMREERLQRNYMPNEVWHCGMTGKEVGQGSTQ